MPRIRCLRHTEVDDELRNLQTSNPLLPPNTDTTGRLEVVPVHDNMHHQVKGNWNPRLRVLSLALSPRL